MDASVRLLRHATLVIEINTKKILVDPMLSPKDHLDPVQNCGNQVRFPMVGLPLTDSGLSRLLEDTDAIAVTHLHRDHWDSTAQQIIPRNKPVFCQPADGDKIKEAGFEKIVPVESTVEWEGISIHRTNGQHGTGEIGKAMGKVSGFVFIHNQQRIYVAGDTIWCADVEEALNQYKPGTIVLNTGGAKFLTGEPITMTPEDVARVYEKSSGARIIAVHMDTVNHCFIKRADLLSSLRLKGIEGSVQVPADGEIITI